MSDVRTESPKRGGLLIAILTAVVLMGAGAVVYVMLKAADKPQSTGDLIGMRKGTLAKLEVPGHPRVRNPKAPEFDTGISPPGAPGPDIPFLDANGRDVKFSDFKGKVVVLNLWATWCAPCKIEMPTLAKLQAAYQTQPFEVVTLNADQPDKQADARAFLAANAPLKFYAAGGSNILFKFNPPVPDLPGTIIYDKKGVERGRLAGKADWTSKEARELVETLLAEKG